VVGCGRQTHNLKPVQSDTRVNPAWKQFHKGNWIKYGLRCFNRQGRNNIWGRENKNEQKHESKKVQEF
jgi:hypothetical protein